jgi:hypothetical protein
MQALEKTVLSQIVRIPPDLPTDGWKEKESKFLGKHCSIKWILSWFTKIK